MTQYKNAKSMIYIWNTKAKVDQMDKNVNSSTFPSVDKDMGE